VDFQHFETSCRSALKKGFRKYAQWAGSPPLLIEYELITLKSVSKTPKNENFVLKVANFDN
jgi:hypothetical protein